MARAGETLDNPVTDERIIFRETAADTGGERLAIDVILAPDGHVPGAHVHPSHDEPAHVRVEVRSALKMEQLFETTVALARDRRTNGRGMPKPLDLALFVREYEDEVRDPFPPAPIVTAVMAPLRWMAKRRGHAERYAIPALRPAAAV